MKITMRLPEAMYAFTEVTFDSMEEYNKEYAAFMKSYVERKPKNEAVQRAVINK